MKKISINLNVFIIVGYIVLALDSFNIIESGALTHFFKFLTLLILGVTSFLTLVTSFVLTFSKKMQPTKKALPNKNLAFALYAVCDIAIIGTILNKSYSEYKAVLFVSLLFLIGKVYTKLVIMKKMSLYKEV